MRALGVVDARARGLVVQIVLPRGGLSYFFLPLGIELREVGPQVVGFGLVLDAGEDHLGAGNFRLRVLDVVEEHVLAPGDAGVLVGLRVAVALDRARLAAFEPVEQRAHLVLGVFAYRVAGQAFLEGVLAGREVLRMGCEVESAATDHRMQTQLCMRLLRCARHALFRRLCRRYGQPTVGRR